MALGARSSPEPWSVAWDRALYGPGGFYRGAGGPRAHFRTANHVTAGSSVLSDALSMLVNRLGVSTVVDVGAGRGELLSGLHSVRDDLELIGVDVTGRPPELPDVIGWLHDVPSLSSALVIGWELLDNVPHDVLELDDSGVLRQVLVDAGGHETLGDPASPEQLTWQQRWWPLVDDEPGLRVELGDTRQVMFDRLWGSIDSGAVLVVDYDHAQDDRPLFGSLAGFRDGRQVIPAPDGSCDVTSHVALDALTLPDGLSPGRVVRQREALLALGVHKPNVPRALLDGDVGSIRSSRGAVELLDVSGLGGFGWLLATKSERTAGFAA